MNLALGINFSNYWVTNVPFADFLTSEHCKSITLMVMDTLRKAKAGIRQVIEGVFVNQLQAAKCGIKFFVQTAIGLKDMKRGNTHASFHTKRDH